MEYFRLVGFFVTSVGLSAEGLRDPGPDFGRAPRAQPDLRPKLRDGKGGGVKTEETHNHYKTLGVGWDAPQDVIRKNYKQLALFYHPDKQVDGSNPDASAQFSSISEAYAVLSDPLRRLVYDLVLGIRDKTDKEARSLR
jgi:DnaJ-domain-containing protein 1